MLRSSLSATPCPVLYPLSGMQRMSTASFDSAQDSTTDLDYTRAIAQEFKNAKPRRRSTFQRRERKDAAITIFEDVVEDQELVFAEPKKKIGGSVLLGKAARKMPRSSIARREEVMTENPQAQEEARTNRRVSTLADSIPGLRFKMSEPVKEPVPEPKPKGGLKKDPRRRTIFMPEDTTMLTIHPGANTTDRLNDTFQLCNTVQPPPPKQAPMDDEAKTSPKPVARRPRLSLAVAPKRLPLQHVAADKSNVPALDVPGHNGGKENLPPRAQASNGDKKSLPTLLAPTAASQARGSIQARRPVQPPGELQKSRTTGVSNKTSLPNAIPKTRHAGRLPADTRSSNQQRPQVPIGIPKTSSSTSIAARHQPDESAIDDRPHASLEELSAAKLDASKISRPKPLDLRTSTLQRYSMLPGDLAQPELYEEDWLRHQEVALTEVINQILSRGEQTLEEEHSTDMSLRDRLVEIYHQPHVSTMYQRIQASLQYGALSTPKNIPPILPSQDIGLRKRFLSLWLDSYDEKVLKDAVEVVVGRQIPRTSVSAAKDSIETALDPHRSRRALIRFLETFFVEVQDVATEVDAEGRWRKMVVRSLMLAWLLDQTKGAHAIKRCLFKASSPRKSTTQMLYALAAIVLPSIGDITRALRHCDYSVSCDQDPLDEVTYRIHNLASDMRDGIFLTRLVEMLVFSQRNMRIKGIEGGECTVTIQLPDCEQIWDPTCDWIGERFPLILSQYLKMPCLGRAQKLFNVEIALTALRTHGRLDSGAHHITADDIVNGHREKTMSLLWSLVSNHGLDSLVDFRELMKDIQRYSPEAELLADGDFLSQYQQESQLQAWATAICAKDHVPVTNLTSSFADGRAYPVIVEAFAPFCGSQALRDRMEVRIPDFKDRPHARPQRACAALLRALGCSAAFTASLTSITHTITSRQTTVSNLAFLASRLLPLKRRHNAAVTIQRAFRVKHSKVIASQRVTLMRLAHACATVVQTKNRVENAATVLQRAWRDVLRARIGRLNGDVEEFQVWARGWLARRRMMASRRAGIDRVMGGW